MKRSLYFSEIDKSVKYEIETCGVNAVIDGTTKKNSLPYMVVMKWDDIKKIL